MPLVQRLSWRLLRTAPTGFMKSNSPPTPVILCPRQLLSLPVCVVMTLNHRLAQLCLLLALVIVRNMTADSKPQQQPQPCPFMSQSTLPGGLQLSCASYLASGSRSSLCSHPNLCASRPGGELPNQSLNELHVPGQCHLHHGATTPSASTSAYRISSWTLWPGVH